MVRKTLPLRCVGLIAVLLLATGCGGGKTTAQGTVTYDGQPITSGAVLFMPKDKGNKIGARIYNGKYEVEPKFELVPGQYDVVVTWDKGTGKFVSEGSDKREITEEGLPAKYNTNTTLTADLKAGPNTVDFTLAK